MRINRVTEIRNTEMPVYDIEVENEHCYYLDNGVLTHNTQETYSKTVVSGGCLVEGTKLQMADGTLKEIQNILVGDAVTTLQGAKEVTAVWNPDTLEEGTPECFEIEFDDGYSVVCSDNHPFLTTDGWVKAKDLQQTHFVVSEGLKRDLGVVSKLPLGRMPVFDISVKDAEHYVLENGVVTHNTGILYSCDNAIVLGRQQEKEGTELLGYNFIMNIEKSRFVKEKSKLPLRVTFEGGIDKFSGLFDIALDVGFITSEKKGWYSVPSLQIENVRRSKLERSGTFWRSALEGGLKTLIEERYRLGEHVMLQGGDEEEAIDDDSDVAVDDE